MGSSQELTTESLYPYFVDDMLGVFTCEFTGGAFQRVLSEFRLASKLVRVVALLAQVSRNLL